MSLIIFNEIFILSNIKAVFTCILNVRVLAMKTTQFLGVEEIKTLTIFINNAHIFIILVSNEF